MLFIFASTFARAARSASFAAAMHEVGEQLGVVGSIAFGSISKLLDLAAGGRGDGHRAAAGARGSRSPSRPPPAAAASPPASPRLLRRAAFMSMAHWSSSLASNVLFISSTISSSLAGASSAGRRCSGSSPSANDELQAAPGHLVERVVEERGVLRLLGLLQVERRRLAGTRA